MSNNGFSTILMDPPWQERGAGRIKRGAQVHYPLLKTKDMPDVIKGSGKFTPAKDAHLYLWATNSFLADGIWLMNELGFRYITNIVWVKDKIGLGQYFRGNHELLLFGTRGLGFEVKTETRSLISVIHAPRSVHSKKPIQSYELIEARSKGPYLEMFARSTRPGWSSWGNEVQS